MFFTFFVANDNMFSENNMKKSIPSFVNTLIFSILGAILAYLFWIVFIIVGSFANNTLKTLCTIIPFVNMVLFGIMFIASFLYLIKPKFASIIALISSLFSIVCLIILCVSLKTFSLTFILFWLPAIIIFINSLVILTRKNKSN